MGINIEEAFDKLKIENDKLKIKNRDMRFLLFMIVTTSKTMQKIKNCVTNLICSQKVKDTYGSAKE